MKKKFRYNVDMWECEYRYIREIMTYDTVDYLLDCFSQYKELNKKVYTNDYSMFKRLFLKPKGFV